jgi:hypothetical protein
MTEVLTPDQALAAMPRVSPGWLERREAADAAARAADLLPLVRHHLAGRPTLVVHDLGCGTGSVRRWLGPRLPGPQHWILHDRDADLLDAVCGPGVSTRHGDISRLTADDLAGADLVTGGALLDLLTTDEVDAVAGACAGAGVPALFSLNVVGRVELDPYDPLDDVVAAAFNDHQRRVVAGRRLLGPDAVDVAVAAFHRHGVATVVRPSPWRLGSSDVDLIADWFAGWLGPARAQDPALAGPSVAYAARRRAELAAGRLRAVVHHVDLLAVRP